MSHIYIYMYIYLWVSKDTAQSKRDIQAHSDAGFDSCPFVPGPGPIWALAHFSCVHFGMSTCVHRLMPGWSPSLPQQADGVPNIQTACELWIVRTAWSCALEWSDNIYIYISQIIYICTGRTLAGVEPNSLLVTWLTGLPCDWLASWLDRLLADLLVCWWPGWLEVSKQVAG